MKSNKLRILTLALVAILAQSTCALAASSNEDDYTDEELNNLEPGFDYGYIDKSNYKVNSAINSYSSEKTPEQVWEEDDTSSTPEKIPEKTTLESNAGNIPTNTIPSTGNRGDFWGKTSGGKWILYEQGVPVSGWRMVKGSWYYMDPEGVMQTGWINDGQTWYYLNASGQMAYNTYVDGYYLNWSGAMQ